MQVRCRRTDVGFRDVPLVLKGTTPCPQNRVSSAPVHRRWHRATGVRRGDLAVPDFITAGDGAATTSSSPLKGADGASTTAQATTPTT
ncbi:hypothetical protein HPB52_016806 [Rhipicephalus sanguineus]|uniref:Uncharacterized protein n=1 Tax=Rhipicephalus sanguineus TaxID=34632 RepID=A0A9D4QGZ0_RHISA|nr:hypothetical protein HPB52_016806 [Rhipicephalus sanguineus]